MKNVRTKKHKATQWLLLLMPLFLIGNTPKDESKIFKNLNAKETTYFSFASGNVATEKDAWDLSFNHTTIEVKNEAQLLDKNFDAVENAPKNGYQKDGSNKKAIPTGSGNGWYKYSMFDHSINPLPGKVIIVKTSDNRYVKVEILSYYKDMDGASGYYTFRYQYIEP